MRKGFEDWFNSDQSAHAGGTVRLYQSPAHNDLSSVKTRPSHTAAPPDHQKPSPQNTIWVSYSSINDYLRCPKSYFLKNVYRNPKTKRKIQIVAPAISLGQAVHEVLESISVLPVDKRFNGNLVQKFQLSWAKTSGKKGGFHSKGQEQKYYDRGVQMLERIMEHPGVLARKSVKIRKELPHFYLSQEEQIILCGKIDWLEFIEEKNGIRIIDFKTGLVQEDQSSLQLPIYHLLAHHCQSHPVLGVAYWYLETDDELQEKELPSLPQAQKRVLEVARQIIQSRLSNNFICPRGDQGCTYCRQFARILQGEGEFVGVSNRQRDLYYLAW